MFKKSNLDFKRSQRPSSSEFFNKHFKGLLILFGSSFVSIFISRLYYISRIRRLGIRADILFRPPLLNNEENISIKSSNLSVVQKRLVWDAVIVGAGPAGSTAAYYLAKQQLNVLIIDKESFPRDKICGDQIQPQVQHILSEMGILSTLLDEDVIKWSVHRGIVSPLGISFIGDVKDKDSFITVQRIVLDDKIANVATSAGAILLSKVMVNSAYYTRQDNNKEIPMNAASSFCASPPYPREKLTGNYWTIKCKAVEPNAKPFYVRTKVLICADGADSNLARSLQGLFPEESPSFWIQAPNSMGCRAFVKPRTHNFRADEVIFYTQNNLPGAFRICSELEDFLSCTSFVLPRNDYSEAQLPTIAISQFNTAIKYEPWVVSTLGPSAQITPVRYAPMRVGGISKAYFPQGLILGDAAGQQDPLTGDGLQYGMQAAKMAAEVLGEIFRRQNFSISQFQKYDRLCKKKYDWDFFWARQIASLMARFPILVDAVVLVIRRHGIKAIVFWALAKAGMKSKWELILWFLRPDVAWLIVFYSINLLLRRIGLI